VPAGITAQKFTAEDHWDYTVAELRGIATGHGLVAVSRLRHDELVALITAADIPLPPKPPERLGCTDR
jgi:hypothetical protein